MNPIAKTDHHAHTLCVCVCLSLSQVLSSCRLPASGAYCVATDKVEQVLDLIRGATDNLGLQLNRDVSLFVDVGAERFYDEVSCIFSHLWPTFIGAG